jgi:menaquinone-dependent protoporphyrinogen oxidase
MTILVSAASKHGATTAIADALAARLKASGQDAVVHDPESVTSLEPYEAVIAGSAIYMGRWLPVARDFVDRHEAALRERPAWVFSSGPLGEPPQPDAEPEETLAIAQRIGARDHRSFAGKIDRDDLGFLERTIIRAVKAPEGDYRDWDAIIGWADQIAEVLNAGVGRGTRGARW